MTSTADLSPHPGYLVTEPPDTLTAAAHGAGLVPILAPHTIAVVGAQRRSGAGHDILEAICAGGFTGRLYPVNREACLVCGCLAKPSLHDIHEPVDLVILATPAAEVRDALSDAARIGARAVVIVTACDPADGGPTLSELAWFAETHGIRIVGPGSAGVLNTDPAVRLNACYAAAVPAHGGLAVVAGADRAADATLLEELHRAGLAVSSFVSVGQAADVNAGDLLAAWANDRSVDAVAVLLDRVADRARLSATVQDVAARKPVLLLQTDRARPEVDQGAGSGLRTVGADEILDVLLDRSGVVEPATLDDLIDAARLLSGQPRPVGPRLGVVGNAPDADQLIALAAAEAGLVVPTCGQLPNPWALALVADPRKFSDAIALLLDSGEADLVLVTVTPTRVSDLPGILSSVGRELDRRPDIPAAVVVPGHQGRTLGARQAPVFGTPDRAVRAFGAAVRHAGHRARQAAHLNAPAAIRPPEAARRHAAALAARVLADGAGPGAGAWQPAYVAAGLLAAYGVQVIDTSYAATEEEAVTVAADRYPVAIKAQDPGLLDKSRCGGVVLAVSDPHETRAAFRYLTGGIDGDPAGVLVQPMVEGAFELVVSAVRDPALGCAVSIIVGGEHDPLPARQALCPVPVTPQDAREAWQSLATAVAQRVRRDAAVIDPGPVLELLARVGRLLQDVPEVAELHLDPVLLGHAGAVTVDVKLRLQHPADGIRCRQDPWPHHRDL